MPNIHGTRIAGIASTVPKAEIRNIDLNDHYDKSDIKKIIKSSGVERRRIVGSTQTASDLCYEATVKLLDELNWDRDSIDLLIFVSQTPDYQLPATSCVLHGRLGLPANVAAFDISLGCSGYVYGLQVASSLMQTGYKRALLLVGDAISTLLSPEDRGTVFLFGDAGTATALEQSNDGCFSFVSGTDGSGYRNIIVVPEREKPERSRGDKASEQSEQRGIVTGKLNMSGAEVFTFTLKVVPTLVKDVLELRGISLEQIDYFVFHQANAFILAHLAKKLGIDSSKFVTAINSYGNTSGASIPLTICEKLNSDLNDGKKDMLLAGFGVGLSWSAAICEFEQAVILPVLEV